MFCYNCGAKLREDEKFCYKCGTRVRERTAAPRMAAFPGMESESVAEEKPAGPPVYSPEALEAATEGSWGENMPSVPNQYNYPGSPEEYFMEVLRDAFPGKTVRKEEVEYQSPSIWIKGPDKKFHEQPGKKTPACIFTIQQNGRILLAVELLSVSSKNFKQNQKSFADKGIPYIRFYHDVPGWWNTRAYVTQRALAAAK